MCSKESKDMFTKNGLGVLYKCAKNSVYRTNILIAYYPLDKRADSGYRK